VAPARLGKLVGFRVDWWIGGVVQAKFKLKEPDDAKGAEREVWPLTWRCSDQSRCWES